jgi:dTDP-4-dehydrorhamnose reductase
MVAATVRELATGTRPRHPVLDVSGWWRRPVRSVYPPLPVGGAPGMRRGGLLITGARGTLGRAFARVCASRGLPSTLLGRSQLDIADEHQVGAVLDRHAPWAVINAAGYVRLDDAERDRERCHRENVVGAARLAAACAERDLPYVTFSSDLVFDGRSDHFVESSPTGPLNYYGRTKCRAERAVLAAGGRGLVIRTSAFFGPWDSANFVALVRRALAGGEPVHAADDVWVSPTYVPELAHVTLDLLLDRERGVWHLANDGAVTWADLARAVARLGRYPDDLVVGRPARAMGWLAPRPTRSVLRSRRGALLSPLDQALARYFDDAPPLTQQAVA